MNALVHRVYLILLFALFLLSISFSSSPSLLNVVYAVPSETWTGEFQYSFPGAAAGGGYLGTGSGSFTFIINPDNSITGMGTGQQSIRQSAQCSGGGGTGYTFPITGSYDPIFNNISIAAGPAVPQQYTIPLQPTKICSPWTTDVQYGFIPEAANIRAQDGASIQCLTKSCDAGITYKITIHGSQFCTSTGAQKLIFYVEDDGFPSGHGFVQFETNTGPQAYKNDLVYGHSSVYGPYNDGFTRGPNAPQHGLLEADHPWDWRIIFHVSPCQYDAAANFVNSEIANPSPYSLTSLNCIDWINMVAASAGLELPPSTDFIGVSDPATLGSSFENIGNGGTFDGGLVQQNLQGLTPQNTPDPPSQDEVLASPVELSSYAINNSTALALSQNMTVQQIALKPVTLGTSGVLGISLQNFVSSSLVLANYGDGSSSNATLSSYLSHSFDTTGTYEVRVAVLNFESLDEFLVNVTLSDGSVQAVNVTATVPFTSVNATTAPQAIAEQVFELNGNQTNGNVTESSIGSISGGLSSASSTSITTLQAYPSSFAATTTANNSSNSASSLSSSYLLIIALFVLLVCLLISVPALRKRVEVVADGQV